MLPYLLQVFKTEIFYPVIKVKVIKVIKVSGEKHFPIVYINNIYIYYSSKWPIPIFLMTLMTLTLMTAFHVSSATFNAYFPVLQCFCNKVLIENDRKYYLSATYAIFSIES